MYFRSVAFFEEKRSWEAERELSAAIEIAPTVAKLYFHRARLRVCTKPADALSDLARVVEMQGSATPCILHYRAAAHNRLAEACTDSEQKKHYLDLVKSDKEAIIQSEPKTAKGYALRGYYLNNVNPEEALASYRSAIRLNPKDFLSWYNQACVLTKQLKKPEDAVLALDKSIEVNPQFADAIADRALLKARLGHRDEAVADAERGLKIGTPHASIVYTAACVYAITSKTEPKDADKAMALFKRAAKEGFHDTVRKYAKDKDLAEFKDRPDFQKLVNSINTIVQ
jgi:tetratricopeptide (TPR) repeat protein